ncbi:Crp/Fnr family transcriptional regulator [Companilactobacillus sp.]|jgi:CRP-like cAMP-binding protein|uniref:Crp/Fnr family transcriptional regulator n=1 Tax=Companilactobacillus sp. TaxID=2767905 RepID=UPI0025B8941B|nr:Crp/Fnr family transcriptional regulator [Companilactobacillus sp.]MCH4009752.1 Crp/Fnr family transcriptional regulator [Companilactobacillus sp.]MCH4052572.1 Crp/Fnr family transcriptional regulator [Companilactobacillus sp.]MCH4077694.1 Crp/Fnr family transcriptional regulator [Companilactobacillus sp.]MCH4126270.1 Crp/Fnr family transcriptional regulator [Companilactobacillus sp.]MCI1311978.1 Crp/Fnr family transcriptional regulator [Companilactobacillus sp.]
MEKIDVNKFHFKNFDISDLKQHLTTKTVPAKTTLLYQGDVAENVYIVEQGLLRLWNNDDGRDITFQFFFENQMVSSFESLYLNQPSNFSIESLEDTTVQVLSKKSFEEILDSHEDVRQFFTQTICKRFIDYTHYFLSRIKENPQDRYEELVETEPEILKRVPQYYIASYLGITPVSLSRIRNKAK